MIGAIVIVTFELCVLAVICALLLRVFVSYKKTPWYALLSTWLGWLLCFAIVFMVPIDILDTDHENCLNSTTIIEHNVTELTNITCVEPITYLPEDVMVVQWKILWWGTMIFSWLLFPILQSYFLAGDFSVWERIVRSIKENIILYLVLGVLGIIGVIIIYATAQLTQSAFAQFMLGLANAYGLILTICLMGYGLVDIPRYLFRKSNRIATLRYYSVMAYKYKEGIEKAKGDLLKTLKVVKTISDKVRDHDPYRPYLDIILRKCPLEYGEVTGDSDAELSYSKLVNIHERVSGDTHSVARAVCLYEQMLKKAFKTEDIVRTKTHPQSDWKIYWSFKAARTHKLATIFDALEYLWEIHLFTPALRLMAVLTSLLSLCIVWCELTLTTDKSTTDLSPFSNIIKAVPLEGIAKQIFCLIIIFYMALCAYTTLFKIKIFNYYRLVPHQMSDANSIMFSANYLCRLAAPLSYNFLSLVNVDDKSFDDVMGSMTTATLGHKFAVFFPIFVAFLCLATIFNLYSKIGAMCCIKRLRYYPTDDEKLVDEGERILQEEREIKEGKGPIQLTTKETIKSTIREQVSNMAEKSVEKDREVEAYKEKEIPPTPTAPPTISAVIASKYGFNTPAHRNDDLLPATSRFSSKRTRATTEAPLPDGADDGGESIRPNFSSNSLASRGGENGAGGGGGMRRNLTANSLSTMGSVNAPNPPNPPANNRVLPPNPAPHSTTPAQTLTTPRPKPPPNNMLPPTSRFAQKPSPPTPVPAPSSAILVSNPSEPASSDSKADNKSLLGGLFGGKGGKSQFSLMQDPSR